MPATCQCVPSCGTTLQTVNVPGIEGAAGLDGADGAAGIDAFSFTTANFIVPAVGDNVTIPVSSSVWMGVGQHLWIEGGVHVKVVSKATATSIIAENLGYAGDALPAATITSGAQVSPGGVTSKVHAVTATNIDYTVTTSDEVIVVTADNKTVTLPPAADMEGRIVTVKVTAAFTSGVTVAADGSETIDGAASVTTGAIYDFVSVISDGTDWHVIASQLT